MAGTSRLSTRASADFPVPGVRLTHFQARLWDWLRGRRHLERGICQATRTIAGIFGVGVRTVQLALKFFRDLGVLDREWDYELNTRRRYYVTDPRTPPLGAADCAHSANVVAPTNAPPLEPPIEVSGESEEKGIGGGGETPPPDSDQASPIQGDPTPLKASPEEVATLVETAKGVLPGQPREWILALAAKWAPAWVLAALRRAKLKRDGGGAITTGYVIGCLKGFKAEGGPPAELTAPEQTEEESLREFAEILARTPDVTW